jgi:signal transduction histidine kinase
MGSRSSHVRIKVAALLVSLVALWAFAAVVTLRAGLDLLWVGTLDQQLSRPTDNLVTALQQERRLSLVSLNDHTDQQHAALVTQRAQTDQARATFERLAKGFDVKVAESTTVASRVSDMFDRLKGLGEGRAAIDAGIVDRRSASATFTDVINAGFRIYNSLAILDDAQLAREAQTLVDLTKARELMSEEDALLNSMVSAGKYTPSDHAEFVQLVNSQRFLYATTAAELAPADAARYAQFTGDQQFTQFKTMEDNVVATTSGPLPATVDGWQSAIEPVFSGLHDVERAASDDRVARAKPGATWVIVRLVLAGGLGLVAVIASIVISITTTRSLVRRLEKLRASAWELANHRLPRVVERIRAGENVDIAAEAPPLDFGGDEVGLVGDAFNAVQQTAVKVAVEQAELRRGVRDVFLSLARRTQALVHRQLGMLDAMERRETEPEELDDLFRVDHLATRMRRNAENLIVLSGAVPGRGWRNPVPVVDVVRAAVAEVEDYARVKVLPIGSAALVGRGVGDVIHLLAELVENATSFSPPETLVQIGGQKVANGYAIEIEDRGLGMPPEDLAAANDQLRDPPEFNLSSTARLGLYVVGRLAERHGIKVSLRDSPYGGTTAIVLVPAALVVDEAARQLPDGRREAIAGRHAAIPGAQVAEPTEALRYDGPRAVPAQPTVVPVPAPVPPPAPAPVAPVPVAPVPVAKAEAPPVEARPMRTPMSVLVRSNMRVRPREAAEPRTVEPRTVEPRPVEAPRPVEGVPVARGQAQVRSNGNGHGDNGRGDNGRPRDAEQSEEPTFTTNGLPRRVRQASLAGPLYDDKPAVTEQHDSEDLVRAPEDIRRMMASYQSGTKRGRTEAERSVEVGTPADADGGPGGSRPLDENTAPWTSTNPWDR